MITISTEEIVAFVERQLMKPYYPFLCLHFKETDIIENKSSKTDIYKTVSNLLISSLIPNYICTLDQTRSVPVSYHFEDICRVFPQCKC
jgi:hypothetical protein